MTSSSSRQDWENFNPCMGCLSSQDNKAGCREAVIATTSENASHSSFFRIQRKRTSRLSTHTEDGIRCVPWTRWRTSCHSTRTLDSDERADSQLRNSENFSEMSVDDGDFSASRKGKRAAPVTQSRKKSPRSHNFST